MNINVKGINESKTLLKQNIRRSKSTLSTATKILKRPAAAPIMHGEAKKPLIRPSAKPVAQRTGTILTTKSSQNTTGRKVQNDNAPKPSKWDIKGRLAHTHDMLSNVRQQLKESVSKCNELHEQVNTLKANEAIYKTKAEEYETKNKVLNSELKEMKVEMNKAQEQREDLAKRLKESEESFQNATNMLETFKEKCSSQEIILQRHDSVIKDLETRLQNQIEINEELNATKNALQSLVHTMDKDRRVLHNAIQELKGNIRVFCRVRPRTPTELGKAMCAMNFVDECTIEVRKSDGSDVVSCSGKWRGIRQEFSFDKVFPPTAKQETIFEELAMLVQSALEGYNVCVFAYGQTGSGKTYTMEGLPGIETEGMISRTVRHIFQEMKQFQLLGWEYRIEASFLEIYNEHIVDLLDSQSKMHEIRMTDSKGHDLYVSNLKIEEIHSPEELHECLITAQRNRAVAATQSNERSSRSHSVARIKLIGTHQTKEEVSIGNLNLVDLAGSERLKGEESIRTAETKNINKSLANLGNVILALLKKQEHVPYRNSKLTHLLMPSLGGNSKTLMLLNISPLDECYNETLNSLRFASNVNNCKTGNAKRTRTVLQNSIQFN
ncbi:Protein claret segregational [Habropoda laboriosa]|uniref:Protein claret segregational n=2 Tax=Habropoda laboriosa TaxID=597456 RepID=A0A0L7QW86_9HYME|nr:Protein claret segregational [Habropoda laboriosa]